MSAPSQKLISLTEAVTGILGGVEQTEDQVLEVRVLKVQHNLDKWWDANGPEYLKKGLGLLVAGRTWMAREDVSEDNNAIDCSWFAKVEKWLAASGLAASVALAEVQEVLEAEQAQSSRKKLLYDRLWSDAAAGTIELWGLRRDDFGRFSQGDQRRPQSGDYEQIPRSYFFRPAMHWMGNGYHGKGEISPAYLDDEVFRSVLSDDADADRRPSYLRVMISRVHADQLREAFKAGDPQMVASSPSNMAVEANCLEWLISEMGKDKSQNATKAEFYRKACAEFPSIGKADQAEPSRPFIRVWDKAKDAIGGKWGQPGRRKKGGGKKGAPV